MAEKKKKEVISCNHCPHSVAAASTLSLSLSLSLPEKSTPRLLSEGAVRRGCGGSEGEVTCLQHNFVLAMLVTWSRADPQAKPPSLPNRKIPIAPINQQKIFCHHQSPNMAHRKTQTNVNK
jgi:hypothetical protein